MNEEYFALKFIQTFPEYEKEYKEHLESYGEILGHVFFGNAIDSTLSNMLLLNKDKVTIRKYIDFIEDMNASGNEAVQNIVAVTIMAYLGDDDTVLKNAFTYFSEDIMKVSKDIEAGYGRRKIHIYYKKGKVYADW